MFAYELSPYQWFAASAVVVLVAWLAGHAAWAVAARWRAARRKPK